MYDTRSLTPKPVEKLPNNINGNVALQLHYDNKERQKMKSSQDGRSWKRYHKSYTYYFKSSHGTRLRASCKGSFRCKNSGCPYLKYYNSENSQRVLKEGDETNCEECGGEMEFIHCDAVKIWQFPRDKNFVNVYHFGDHTCPVINKPYPQVIKLNQCMN
ncbi:unnamed protein product [Mytilus coruscus]|uniref:Uncharacterized protein n=1 Tax=Mytilus coruscus TaxID=42192 RepID=A0A6J8E6G8_MYTCO|nr:unnamed protein product [Mytilus coruscus]